MPPKKNSKPKPKAKGKPSKADGAKKAKSASKPKNKGKDASKKVGSKASASKKADSKAKGKGSKTDLSKAKGKKSGKKEPSVKKGLEDSKTDKTQAVKGEEVKKIAAPTPEIVAKNAEFLKSIEELIEKLKPDQVTQFVKDDLDRVQALVKNIAFRNSGQMNRMSAIDYTELQLAVFKKVSPDLLIDCEDKLFMTITGAKGASPAGNVKLDKTMVLPDVKLAVEFKEPKLVVTK